jgi:hypothetical protein
MGNQNVKESGRRLIAGYSDTPKGALDVLNFLLQYEYSAQVCENSSGYYYVRLFDGTVRYIGCASKSYFDDGSKVEVFKCFLQESNDGCVRWRDREDADTLN